MSKKGAADRKTATGRLLVELDPDTIYFTHARIRPVFTGCNKRIQDTLEEILSGETDIADIPYITVIENFEAAEGGGEGTKAGGNGGKGKGKGKGKGSGNGNGNGNGNGEAQWEEPADKGKRKNKKGKRGQVSDSEEDTPPPPPPQGKGKGSKKRGPASGSNSGPSSNSTSNSSPNPNGNSIVSADTPGATPFYFSLNNRRLYLFKTLKAMGKLETIHAQVKPALERERVKYTRDRCVLRAKIMGAGQRRVGEGVGDGEGEQSEEEESGEEDEGDGEGGEAGVGEGVSRKLADLRV